MPSKMPTTSKVQVLLPSFCGKMFDWIGTLSPSFQPKRSASPRPTSIPVRVLRKASFSASVSFHSVKIGRKRSGGTTKPTIWFCGSW